MNERCIETEGYLGIPSEKLNGTELINKIREISHQTVLKN